MKQEIKVLLLLFMVSLPVYVSAQGFEDEEDVEDQVPLDGGLSLLAAGGVTYGIKKWHELKKSKST